MFVIVALNYGEQEIIGYVNSEDEAKKIVDIYYAIGEHYYYDYQEVEKLDISNIIENNVIYNVNITFNDDWSVKHILLNKTDYNSVTYRCLNLLHDIDASDFCPTLNKNKELELSFSISCNSSEDAKDVMAKFVNKYIERFNVEWVGIACNEYRKIYGDIVYTD